MGCDGGTIPRRDELVKVKKKPEAKDKDAELAFKWKCCSITQQFLQAPIVMCGLGRFYNKLSLIEALLNRDTLPECARHIKSLKDVKNLNLTPNPAFKGNETKGTPDIQGAPYICPVIGLEMSGKFKFVALWSCGCVFSERALKEIKTTNCHKCTKPFDENDVVVLNPTDEDLVVMKSRMEQRQQKNKKKKIKSEPTEKNDAAASGSSKTKAVKKETGKDGSQQKKRAAVLGSLTESDSQVKKIKADYSVAKDPNATDVYKSLFTSHKSEKEQVRAHWVTYNPFYN